MYLNYLKVAWLWVSTGSPLVSVCPNDSALLRCIFNMDTPSMEIGHLIVIWRIGKRKVLTYENVLTVYRAAGAQLNMDELMKGNASIILPEVDTDDCGDYSCEIIYSGEKKIVYMTLQIDAAWIWLSADPNMVSVCPERNAVLQCFLFIDDPPVDLDHLVVHWKHRGMELLKFDGAVISWRPGAEIHQDELRNGNASLTLHHVNSRDTGNYTCEIIYKGEARKITMHLNIDETNWNCGSRRAKRDNRNSNFTIEGNGRKGVIIALFVWLSGVTFTAIMLWCKGACEEIDDILGVAICVCALLPWDHINAYILK
ncbi:uncharacterized protein LOC144768536 isoform X2 [Lissotriton helveticus]